MFSWKFCIPHRNLCSFTAGTNLFFSRACSTSIRVCCVSLNIQHVTIFKAQFLDPAVYVCVCVCMCECMHIYIYIYIYIYILRRISVPVFI